MTTYDFLYCEHCKKSRRLWPGETEFAPSKATPWAPKSQKDAWSYTPYWQAVRVCHCHYHVECDHRHRHKRTAQTCADKLNRRNP